jgi:hypothetical protein
MKRLEEFMIAPIEYRTQESGAGLKPAPKVLSNSSRFKKNYSGSTVAVSRSPEAKWLFQQEKATFIDAENGYRNCGTALEVDVALELPLPRFIGLAAHHAQA